jgi:tRNA-dihydrouridine synthase
MKTSEPDEELIQRVTQQLNDNHAVGAQDIRTLLEAYKVLDKADVGHSMTGDGMNSLEFFDMIKREWCVSEEQYRPFWNDVLTFARKYRKESKEYCG